MTIRGIRPSAALLIAYALATQANAQFNDIVDLLESHRESLYSQISIKSEFDRSDAVYELDLCRYSLCDVFELRGPRNGEKLDVLLDFALIYLIYTNPYPDFTARELQDPVTGLLPPIPLVIEVRDKGPVLLEKYGENCREGTEAERARCVMRDMAARNSMRFYVARTSSGVRVVMPSIGIITRLNELTPTNIETYIRNAERSVNTESAAK